ncbi:hypothetical protein Tco_1297617 [Tanacetum coccineum]
MAWSGADLKMAKLLSFKLYFSRFWDLSFISFRCYICKNKGVTVFDTLLTAKLHLDQNYNMHSMGKTVNELHAMLKLHEETLPKKVVATALHAIRAGKCKMVDANAAPSYAPKPKNPPPPKKVNPAKDAICHHCGEVGYGTHICNTTQGLRGSKKLNPGALSLYVGNGQCEAVEAIANYHLCLPSRLVIVLNNFHYATYITRGIISVLHLYEDGFVNRFELNNAISVSKNNVVYFTAIPRDGLYEIEMSCSNTNDSSMYTVSNKRAKLNLGFYASCFRSLYDIM